MSDGGADPAAERPRRPAPQYGEYATPEEVAAITGMPVRPPAPPPRAPGEPLAPPTGAPIPGAPPAGIVPPWDPAITFTLLVVGLFQVVNTVVTDLQFPSLLSSIAQQLSGQSFDVPASTQVWGYVLIGFQAALLVATAAVSFRLMALRRRTFWVPLVAGVIASLTQVIVMLIVLSDIGALGVLQNQG